MWQKKSGVEHDSICGRTLQHVIHTYNSVTGAEHNLQLLLKVPCCATCGRPFAQTDLGILDPQAEVTKALAALQENHEAIMEYARTHNVPILIGPLATVVPEGHRAITSRAGRSLILPRRP